ncbi:MAG: sensor histidine kinase [Lachnospiraceae bacterium]|nr:sensor histidine kinase [Lachnospiraceae bacterium]
MSVFKSYLREDLKNVILCIAGYCVCALVLALYGMLGEALLYGGVLYLLLILIVFTTRFIKYVRHASDLRGFLDSTESGKNVEFIPKTLGERELTHKIEELAAENSRLATELKTVRQDYSDYYTVWVHQIKTPIAAMKMMLEREDTKENRELLGELFRIERYVEMVLGYNRLESDSSDLVIREYDVDEMIKQAVRKFAPQFVERRLKLDYDPVNKKISTDEKWFVFLIEQILSNAVKYTKQGGITIRYSETGEHEGMLGIYDTGIGIAPEDLPRIFEKGYTGFNGRADKKATGLGLYLCKRVCDMLSIGITAESEPGKGSVFYLDLRQRVLKHD